MFPKIFLAVDNCFASKRWTEPREWMEIAREADIFFVEASADTEIDPLYSTPEVLADWRTAVEKASKATDVRVANLYSGHGSYATLGLSHPDVRVRDHIQNHWLMPMIDCAGMIGADLGFFCHAFPQSVLADTERYTAAETDLYLRLGQLADYASHAMLNRLSVEQMYSPHQIPWTIDGAERMLREVKRWGRTDFYLTLDTGHQVGQRHFMNPNDPPHMRAAPEDGDLYAWLRRVGRYSPILHLQQSDGHTSAHRPFTEKYNATGIVRPAEVLRALAESYAQPLDPSMPQPVRTIYLTLEIFSPTAERPEVSRQNIIESAAYWRQFVPKDGMLLDELVGAL